MNNGWIKLHRKMIGSSVFDNPNHFKVWIWCLMKATHTTHTFPFNGKDLEIKSGEFITGRAVACSELSMTAQTYRTSLTYLKSTLRVTIKTTNKFSLIKVNKWEQYQEANQPLTIKQPTTNQPLTTYNKDKKEKNDKNILYSQTNKKNKPYKDFDKFQLNDGATAMVRWGEWTDLDNPKIKIDLGYYKELPLIK